MFRVMLGDQEIGQSPLDALDDGMGVAAGMFTPSPEYEMVRTVFRRLTDALESRDVSPSTYAERDALGLALLGRDDAALSVLFMMIYDFGAELDLELEVKLLDLAQWEKARRHVAG